MNSAYLLRPPRAEARSPPDTDVTGSPCRRFRLFWPGSFNGSLPPGHSSRIRCFHEAFHASGFTGKTASGRWRRASQSRSLRYPGRRGSCDRLAGGTLRLRLRPPKSTISLVTSRRERRSPPPELGCNNENLSYYYYDYYYYTCKYCFSKNPDNLKWN